MSDVDRTPDEAFSEVHKRFQEAVDAGDARHVEIAAAEIFALAEEFFEENPSAELDLVCAAAECEEQGDWSGAERLYREALADTDTEPMTEYQVHSSLAALYWVQNRISDASREYDRTVEAARRADTPILLAMALVDLALFVILEERYQEAEAFWLRRLR